MIYILNQTGTTLYKLGRSKDVKSRVKQLQTGTPLLLEVIKTFKVEELVESQLEKTIHRRFNSYKTQGEWFDFDTFSINSVIEDIELLYESVKLIQEQKRDEMVYKSK